MSTDKVVSGTSDPHGDSDRSKSPRSGQLDPMHQYARDLRSQLPQAIFQRRPIRLVWLPVHATAIAASAALVVNGKASWLTGLLSAIVAGHSWGCLGLLAHETLHHSVVKNRRVEWL